MSMVSAHGCRFLVDSCSTHTTITLTIVLCKLVALFKICLDHVMFHEILFFMTRGFAMIHLEASRNDVGISTVVVQVHLDITI